MTAEGFERLTEEECRRLLLTRTLGRIGFPHGHVTMILPVYYAVLGRDIVFRTSPGAKLDAAVVNNQVAFEVDDEDAGWSVLVTGHATEVVHSEEQGQALEALTGRWPSHVRERVVRIAIEHVSGRRLTLT
jgi:nitroimidazol reductase NimA-like FMN-containing flavoprotein (pyridoxamine 5'-phosphate oxidase superfamily)